MLLQGNLTIEYNDNVFDLIVKTFIKDNVYYFFVSDKEKEKQLLAGETLELNYTDSFCSREKDEINENQKIPSEIVSAVEKMLLENKQLWNY